MRAASSTGRMNQDCDHAATPSRTIVIGATSQILSVPSKWVADVPSAACVARPATTAEAANGEGAAAASKKAWDTLREINTRCENK
eukprot:3821841-Pyramimonas_sp.AAC.1